MHKVQPVPRIDKAVYHYTKNQPKPKPKAGDRKIIKGVEHARCYRMINIGTPYAKSWAYATSSGRQQWDWLPTEEAIKADFRSYHG